MSASRVLLAVLSAGVLLVYGMGWSHTVLAMLHHDIELRDLPFILALPVAAVMALMMLKT